MKTMPNLSLQRASEVIHVISELSEDNLLLPINDRAHLIMEKARDIAGGDFYDLAIDTLLATASAEEEELIIDEVSYYRQLSAAMEQDGLIVDKPKKRENWIGLFRMFLDLRAPKRIAKQENFLNGEWK